MSHPSLDQAIEGFQRGLSDAGFAQGTARIELQNANGEFDKVEALARQLAGQRPDLLFALTTSASRTTVKIAAESKIPVVYAAVTDPIGAGIVTSMSKSDNAVTGVSDRYPVPEQVRVFLAVVPALRSVGVIFNPGEQNSQILSEQTVKEFTATGVKATRYEVIDPAQIRPQIDHALSKHDAIVVNGDNLITEHLEVAIKACVEAQKPLFVGDPDSVARGAVATVGPSYFDMGRDAAIKAAKILKGEPVGTIASSYPTRFDYIVNVKAAKAMGIDIPKTFWLEREFWKSTSESSTAR